MSWTQTQWFSLGSCSRQDRLWNETCARVFVCMWPGGPEGFKKGFFLSAPQTSFFVWSTSDIKKMHDDSKWQFVFLLDRHPAVAELTVSSSWSTALEVEFQVDLLPCFPSSFPLVLIFFSPFFLAILTTKLFLHNFHVRIIFAPYANILLNPLQLLYWCQQIISDIAQGTMFFAHQNNWMCNRAKMFGFRSIKINSSNS